MRIVYDKYIRFRWSAIGRNEWCIDLKDFTNKKYTYYWKGIPVRSISSPVFTGEGYFSYVGLINENYTSHFINIEEIQDISDLRESKIKDILLNGI